MTTLPILWYFADPMCSWCYGFTPVIDAVRDAAQGHYRVALMLGGLRPGTTESMNAVQREEILHHWHAVHERTGQPFAFDDAMPDGFVYDTEPASRAVISVGELRSEMLFDYFKAVQAAFYAQQRDVTRTDVLAALASESGIDAQAFKEYFASDAARQKTQHHFVMTRQAGVRGFPTLILQNGEMFRLITSGYRPAQEVMADIDAALSE